MTSEPWRYRCPKGHTGWKSRTGKQAGKLPGSDYYCLTCHEAGNDPHFDELVDMKRPADRHVVDPEVTAV
jgi:hypothetical protein